MIRGYYTWLLSEDGIFIYTYDGPSRISDDVRAKCRCYKKACPSSNPRRRSHPRTRKPQQGIDCKATVRSSFYKTIHILLFRYVYIYTYIHSLRSLCRIGLDITLRYNFLSIRICTRISKLYFWNLHEFFKVIKIL